MSFSQGSPPISQTRLDPCMIPFHSPHFLFTALYPCCNVQLSNPPSHPQIPKALWAQRPSLSLHLLAPHLALCLHTEGTQEQGVSGEWINEWKNGLKLLEGVLLPLPLSLASLASLVKHRGLGHGGRLIFHFLCPRRGSRCFPKNPVVIVPAA